MKHRRSFAVELKRQKEAALEDRVRQLEQLIGKLTLENEFF